MRPLRVCVLTGLISACLTNPSQAAGTESPFGLERRVPFDTGRIVGTPEPPPPYRMVSAMPKLAFQRPVHVANEPDSDRLFVLEHHGKVWAVEKAPESSRRDLFLEIPRDLYGLTFHPAYAANGFVYVFGHTTEAKTPKNIISRFTVTADRPRRCDPKSESSSSSGSRTATTAATSRSARRMVSSTYPRATARRVPTRKRPGKTSPTSSPP